MTTVELLDRPLYGLGQVDRLLGLRAGTARRWIDGYKRSGRQHEPVIRAASTGDETVTWGEFVEARFLSAYRAQGVSVMRMRPAVQCMRDRFGVPYPLAHVRPWIAGRDLVYEVQEETGLDASLRLVVARNAQLVLTPPSESFLRSIEFDEASDLIVRVLPMGPTSPVTIDPLRQFGEPVVRSVATAVIAEQFQAGDPAEALAEMYELKVADIEAALRYEFESAFVAA